MVGGALGLLYKLLLALIVIAVAYAALSWAVFEPGLNFDQRAIGATAGVVVLAIVLGATVTCFCSRGRITIG